MEPAMSQHHRGFFGDGNVGTYESSWDPWIRAAERPRDNGAAAHGRPAAPTPGRATSPETRSALPAFGPAPETIPSLLQQPRR
jgi:hypothetical protein